MGSPEAMAVIEVVCPHCAACWALPGERIGPGGARVRCARCEGAFEWRVARRITAPAAPPGPSSAVDELDPSDVTPELVARLAVEELVSTRAEDLLGAYDRGSLFASFGPAVIGAWSRCRARLGAEGDPEVFRAALRARIGIDLPGWENRG